MTSETSTCLREQEYQFGQQLSVGAMHEGEIDRFAVSILHVKIRPATPEQQCMGIDRIWARRDGRQQSVEYKADIAAARTGNLFVETVSVDAAGRPGWAYTSLAQLLVQYVPGLARVIISRMMTVKERLPGWLASYPLQPVPNEGYNTVGVLVPLEIFVSECASVTFNWTGKL